MQARERGPRDKPGGQKPAAAQPMRLRLNVFVLHTLDFDRSKLFGPPAPKIEGVGEALVELDGQYRALREEAGFNRLARGLIVVQGADAVEYLQGQLTNDIEALEPGGGCYAVLLDRKGRMQSDMRVLCLTAGELWIEVEPEAVAVVTRHLTMYSVGRDVTVEDRTGTQATFTLAGPALSGLTGLAPLSREHDHTAVVLDGISARSIRTRLGLDLIVATNDADAMQTALSERSLAAVDEAALEILRVESGTPRFGREMTTETIPQEAGINERAVSFTKGCYIGQETVARLHYKGKPNRHLRGLVLDSPVQAGDLVKNSDRDLGAIGTAVLSPVRGPIALAILRREALPGEAVTVAPTDRTDRPAVPAQVVELPFGN